jgi:hypothetical protein
MPWECPACHTPIRYRDYERVLRGPFPYPCHVCYLDLTRDTATDSLVAARPIERPNNTAPGFTPPPASTAKRERSARSKAAARNLADQSTGDAIAVDRAGDVRSGSSQRDSAS